MSLLFLEMFRTELPDFARFHSHLIARIWAEINGRTFRLAIPTSICSASYYISRLPCNGKHCCWGAIGRRGFSPEISGFRQYRRGHSASVVT